VVYTHDRVIVGVKESGSLLKRLNLVILNIEHLLGHGILVHLILHEPTYGFAGSITRVGASRLGRSDDSLILSRDDLSLLLEDKLIGEESEPVLEVRDDAVSGSPGALAIKVFTHRSGGVRSIGSSLGLVEKGYDQRVLSLVVHACYIRLVEEGFSKYLLKNLRFHVVFEITFEYLEFSVLFSIPLLVVNEIRTDQLLQGSEHERAFSLIVR